MSDATDRWRRLEAVFREVAERPEPEHAALLDELCAEDDALRREVESMLAARNEAADFLEDPVTERLAATGAGRTVGRWRLHEAVGTGGMGTVHRAERDEGDFAQQGALKLIAGHALDDELRRRFHRERRILASLEHPNIARLIDGGVTDEGQPYLVMELVRGRSIVEHCDETGLDVDARLDLFDSVCAAVQHAHAQLVVHRDLKPSNILVADDGTVKLLDFGIATVLEEDETRREATVTQQRRYTPQYASPEQVRGVPVTTATDVYSLGLVLYELLAGRRPYEVTGKSSEDDTRLVCETVPPAPSRALDDTRTRRRLRGDLDTIVMTAIRKEPERRYASVEALRTDLRRHRAGQTIAARPDTWSYRTGTFVRRNRLPVAAGILILAVLVAATIVTARQAHIADQERAEAVVARDTSDAVQQFLRSIMNAARLREAGQDATIRDALDLATARIEPELGDRPEVEARVRQAIGSTYRTLGALDAAAEQLERADELAPSVFGPDDPETAHIAHELGSLRRDQGQFDDAAVVLRRALDIRSRTLGDESLDTTESRTVLGNVLSALERYDEALVEQEKVLEIRERTMGSEHPDTLVARNNFAFALLKVERVDEAVQQYEIAYEAQVASLGADHMDTLISASNLGMTFSREERFEEALPWQELAVAGLERIAPPGSIDIVIPKANLARTLAGLERYDEALAIEFAILPEAEQQLGSDHWLVGAVCMFTGQHLLAVERYDEAAPLAERAARLLTNAYGADSSWATNARDLVEQVDEARSSND